MIPDTTSRRTVDPATLFSGRISEMRLLLLFSVLLLILAAKGDGHFPLPANAPERVFQLSCLALTVLFGITLWTFVRDRLANGSSDAAVRVAATIASCFLVLDCALLWLEARRFSALGYAWRPTLACAASLVPAALFAWIAMRRRLTHPAFLLAVASLGYAALTIYACCSFPLTAGRSDMLPLLTQAAHRLVSGQDPYALYGLGTGQPTYLTYLPGLLIAYLPAAILGLDPRWLNILYTLLACALLLHRSRSATASPLLSLFIVNPYLIYRHEIYLAPFWLILAVAWSALVQCRIRWTAATVAIMAVTSQLLFVPAVAMIVIALRRFNRRAVWLALMLAGVAAGALSALFVAPDTDSFVKGTIGHWSGVLNLKTLGLSYWILEFLPAAWLHLIQAGAVLAVLASAAFAPMPNASSAAAPELGRRAAAVAFGVASLALFAFCALNTLIWTYFYLIVLFLALLSRLEPVLTSLQTPGLQGGKPSRHRAAGSA